MVKRFCVLYLLVYFILVLSDFFAIINIDSSDDNQGFNNYYKPVNLTIGISIFIHLLFLSVFLVSVFSLSKFISSNSEIIKIVKPPINLSKNIIVKFFLLLIILITFVRLKDVYTLGIVNYLFQVRSGESTIGGLIYIVLLSYPILLLHKMSRFLRVLTVILMIVLNLLSGFRLILIWSFLIMMFYSWSEARLKISRVKIFGILFVSILILVIGVVRELYQVEDTISGFCFYFSKVILSTNRSSPITYLSYIISNDISFDLVGLAKILVSPIVAFINFVIDIGYVPQESFEIKVFSERIFRGYLVYRGTSLYDATGFSMHFVPFFYSFGGIFFLVFVATIFGILFLNSIRLMSNPDFYTKIQGVLFMVFIFSCLESFSVAWGLFLFSSAILFFLRLCKIVFYN